MEKPSYDDTFMEMADTASKRSIDPSTRHGCVLVDSEHRVVSTGYNGPVQGIDDTQVPLEPPDKYLWMIHAEDNATLFAHRSLSGGTAYITGAPCAPCFRRLVQAGIKRVVYGGRLYASMSEREQAVCERLAQLKGIILEAYTGARDVS